MRRRNIGLRAEQIGRPDLHRDELAVGNRITLDVLDQERELLQARLAPRVILGCSGGGVVGA